MSKFLYEYVIVLQPTTEQAAAGASPRLVTPCPKLAFGASVNAIFLQASREVPHEMVDPANPGNPIVIDPERVQIIVRPFEDGDSTNPVEIPVIGTQFTSLPGKESFTMSFMEAYHLNPSIFQ